MTTGVLYANYLSCIITTAFYQHFRSMPPLFYCCCYICLMWRSYVYCCVLNTFTLKKKMKLKFNIQSLSNKMNCELMLTYDTPAYMFNVYKYQLSLQTGSRNLTGLKMLPTIWHTYMKLVTKYNISAINSC